MAFCARVKLSGPPCEGAVEHIIALESVDSDGNVGTDAFSVLLGNIC